MSCPCVSTRAVLLALFVVSAGQVHGRQPDPKSPPPRREATPLRGRNTDEPLPLPPDAPRGPVKGRPENGGTEKQELLQPIPPAVDGTELNELIRVAQELNPVLRDAAARIEMARGQAVQAGLYPNPTLYQASPQWAGSVSQYNVFVGQDLIIWGKLPLQRAAAVRAVQQAELAYIRTRFDLLTDVRKSFYSAVTAERRVEALERLVGIAARSRELGKKLLQAGEGNRADATLLEIEFEKADVTLRNSLALLTAARRRLAATVGVPRLPPRRLEADLAAALPRYEHEALRRGVINENSLMQIASLEIGRTQTLLRRAVVQPYPDFNIQAGYQYSVQRPFHDQGYYQVSMTVPLWNRNQGNIRTAQADIARAAAQRDLLRNDLSGRAATALGSYRAASQLVERYENEILPKAREVLRINQELFEQGQTDFLRLLQAQKTMLEADLGYLDAQEDRWSSAAEIAGLLQLERFP